jgi:hypothetical protein
VRRLEDGVAGLVVDVALQARSAWSAADQSKCGAQNTTHPGSDANAADLRRQRVGQVVAVQVQRGCVRDTQSDARLADAAKTKSRTDDVELLRARQHLLQRDVGDAVLDLQHLFVLAAAVRAVQLRRGAGCVSADEQDACGAAKADARS